MAGNEDNATGNVAQNLQPPHQYKNMGHCRYVNVSYISLIIQAASITMSFLSEHYQLYYCMLPQCSCFTNILHAHPTIHFCAHLQMTYPSLLLHTS